MHWPVYLSIVYPTGWKDNVCERMISTIDGSHLSNLKQYHRLWKCYNSDFLRFTKNDIILVKLCNISTLHSKVIVKVTPFLSRKSVRDPNSSSTVSLNPRKDHVLCLLLRFLENVFWNTHYLRSQPQNDQDLFAPSEGPIPTHTHTHSHSESRWIKLNCLLLITFLVS